MTTPTPTAQSSACADEVTAGFQRGSEEEIPTILITSRKFHQLHNESDQLRTNIAVLRIDLADAQDKLREAERARDAALRQLAKAVEILTDIQARVREVGV